MSHYVNISLDLSLIEKGVLDLRIPVDMTLKELLVTVFDAYQIEVSVTNPIAHHLTRGQVLSGFEPLVSLKNGSLLRLDKW